MRDFSIVNISPSTNPTIPATFKISFDQTASFHGKEWIDGAGTRYPFYTYDTIPPPPIGTGILLATTFEVVDNPLFNGRYTVFTKATAGGLASSEVDGGGDTVIRVNEAMGTPTPAELVLHPGALTSGRITAITTFVLSVFGESPMVVLEQQNIQTRPVEFTGHRTSGWGEVLFQNMINNAQNYAGATAPANPFIGQLWYDTMNDLLMIRQFAGWVIVNSSYYGKPPFYFEQNTLPIESPPGSFIWTVTHNLGLAAPYVCSASFFVDVGGGTYKSILPSDITYVNPNTLTATFSVGYTGRAIIRA